MEQVMKHYGNAIVAMEFKNTLTGFFDNMNALRPQEEAKKMEKEIESGKDE